MFPPYPINDNHALKLMFKRIWMRYLYLLDPYSGWILPSFIKGLTIIKKNKIDVILVTGPPFSQVISAYFLSRIGRTKFIIDYRDPWTAHPWKGRYTSLFSEKINAVAEKIIIKKADALVFTTKVMRDRTYQFFNKHLKADLHVISNGFKKTKKIKPIALAKEKKVILYAGKFYGERRVGLLAAPLRRLIDNEEINQNEISIHVFGKLKKDDWELLKKYNLIGLINEHSMVDYQTMLRYMSAADVLLLLSGSNVKYAIPYKIFDYMSVRRPILAIAPKNSEVENLMLELDCGEIAYLDSDPSIEAALKKILDAETRYSFSGIDKYEWKEIASKYESVLCSGYTKKL